MRPVEGEPELIMRHGPKGSAEKEACHKPEYRKSAATTRPSPGPAPGNVPGIRTGDISEFRQNANVCPSVGPLRAAPIVEHVGGWF